MKYIVTESQFEKLYESFSYQDLKNWFKFISKTDKTKHPGADTFHRYSMIKAFQKYVDLLFKYTSKFVKFEGVKGINVATVWKENWGEDFSQPERPPSRIDFKVRVYPDLDKSNPPQSQKTFNEQYKKFQEVFLDNSRGMGLEYIQPVEDPRTKNVKIDFDFLNVSLPNQNSEMTEEKDAKFIKCVNCKKKYTQTIHKGKKSLPICPYCGTHNQKDKDESDKS
jgi:hypothetical protein